METINDAAKQYSIARNNSNETQFLYDYESFKSGVEFAQRWISVEEELPEINEFCESKKCLVKNATYNCVDVARYYSNTNTWYFNSTDFVVTHWRPIEFYKL